ncbi:MAG: hypothetical protein LBE92_02435 [Chryseobacterium sp.]|jgi:hypothetical protein|uniref:hypothetical protein n=1 Tax=Chryseobacterium sp. TaxID=1871047 RepID=UPI002834B73E|nr:hypothetical protein [Chryseobacterium sp.]MDR2234958.1 hypothetical protein [Chryseobacterium sp.]
MNAKEKITREIIDFHHDIEQWFHGNTTDREALFQKLLSGFTPEFRMINGNGDPVSLSALSEWLPGVFGKFPNRSITVENIDVQASDSHGLATYIEIQITGDISTKRRSSAVFLVNDDQALWLHLIEKWMDGEE